MLLVFGRIEFLGSITLVAVPRVTSIGGRQEGTNSDHL